MPKPQDAFIIQKNGQKLSYLVKDKLDLSQVKQLVSSLGYEVLELAQPHRNVVGRLKRDSTYYRFKLAGSLGMSVLVENEAKFNHQVNHLLDRTKSIFLVPRIVQTGFFQEKYFYMVIEELSGRVLVDYPQIQDTSLLAKNINQVIQVAEVIAGLDLDLPLITKAGVNTADYKQYFLTKVNRWFTSIPEPVAKKYQLKDLLSIVEAGVDALDKASCHGDFAPWHILLLNDGRLGVIDAEHATSEGVENYDIAYLIQRVYQVLDDSKLAKTIYQCLIDRGYHKGKLQTILVARAIGGFLDEALAQKNYQRAHQFAEWVVGL